MSDSKLHATSIDTAARRRQVWMMILLVAVYASNLVDRTIINVLQQPIKVDLGLDDWQLGILGGTSFAVFYTTLGLAIARLAERRHRPRLLAGCILVWSAFTMLCGTAVAFVHLLAMRIGVAVGEAGATPIGQSLISDSYPPARRAGALATFASGTTIGVILGALIGGFVGQAWGWRWGFFVAGAPGLILAVLVLATIREPRLVAGTDEAVPPIGAVFGTLLRKPAFNHLAGAAALNVFATSAINVFVVPNLMRTFGLSLAEASLLGGAGGGVTLMIGTVLGGFGTQRLAVVDRRWMMWTLAIAMAAAAPLCALAFLSSSLWGGLAAFGLMNVAIGAFQGPAYSTVHSFVGPRMRATSTAIFLLVIQLIGLGLGPLIIGRLSDAIATSRFHGTGAYAFACAGGNAGSQICMTASAQGLREALSLCSIVILWSAFHYWRAGRTLKSDVTD